MKILSRKKGNISIFIIFMVAIICAIVISSMSMIKSFGRMKKSDYIRLENDFKSSVAKEMLKLNFYYSIENSVSRSKTKGEFEANYTDFYSEGIKDVIDEKYYSDKKISISIPESNSPYNFVRKEKGYTEFYLKLTYSEGDTIRQSIHKCRVYNPYEKYGPDKIYLDENRIKSLFTIIN
ncbi:MAG: hypothetical protein SO435_01675 [Peptostreptococcus porci]|uniref:hypothetical protein n=1 Tax=Peptostreptococcus porci TaxID=2652282 RepID=UPI002A7F8087|nr:hypothetical protein [Peptostreptococcus porci]MDY4128435.1 hypothetical protein [Peptostreptococcus porci]MDY4560412.1 hypothetical protein [Peptostreptococcus porci]